LPATSDDQTNPRQRHKSSNAANERSQKELPGASIRILVGVERYARLEADESEQEHGEARENEDSAPGYVLHPLSKIAAA
jgi:hypothetical protein